MMFQEKGPEKKVESAGERVERELFGETKKPEGPQPDYLSYDKAMADVRKRQYTAPEDPSEDFAAAVLASLEEELNAPEKIKFYTAIGTLLDRDHGIDAWFEYEGRMVTIDVTTVQGGKGRTKADIDFSVPRDGLAKEYRGGEEFNKYVDRLTKLILHHLASNERLVRAS